MQSDNDTLLIEYERLRSVFVHAPLTLSVTILNAVLSAIVLRPVDGTVLVASWVVAMVIVSAVRWVGGRRFLRREARPAQPARPGQPEVSPQPYRDWAVFSVLGALATGVLWGTGAVVLFPASDAYQFFLALVIGGMCAGAITVNAAHMPTALGFILPASLPLAARFLMLGPTGQVSALMIVIFASSLCIISQAAHRAFGDRIRLQLALEREQSRLRETNARLLQEISQRQAVEATLHQAQKMEAIGHLTGGIAHDFNNLLQVMIGNMNLIRRLAEDNPRIVKYVAAAEQAAMRGAELTSSLLTFARRQTLDIQKVDINALLREFEPLLRRTLGVMIQFNIDLATEMPLCHADPAHFQSAVLNLVINARDAMEAGGVLSITTCVETLAQAELAGNADARPGRFVSVSVCDTGCGMSAEVMARMFEPFFTTKEAGKGSGLGLSQVYGFARQSHGHVRLLSAPNAGTEATLWLPVARVDDVDDDIVAKGRSIIERRPNSEHAGGEHSDDDRRGPEPAGPEQASVQRAGAEPSGGGWPGGDRSGGRYSGGVRTGGEESVDDRSVDVWAGLYRDPVPAFR
jgi:signal transduction histidine kinase